MTRVLIIGGYGNFGGFIARRLAAEDNIRLILAGRSAEKAQAMARSLPARQQPEAAALDINSGLSASLTEIRPDIVIHTSGPFQAQGYDVARACIAQGRHYIDLADGRAFVEGISALDGPAREKDVLVVSGASSVPCLTSALIDRYRHEFETLDALDYGITTAQKTNRGLATTAAILGYTGKPFQTLVNGSMKDIYGWQDIRLRKYPDLGWRLLGNCDVPDLSLFPKRYPDIKTIRFYAGLEIPLIHLSLWGLSWLVRAGLIKRLENSASLLLKTARLFDWMGTADSGLHMALSGTGKEGGNKTVRFELTARAGDGPYIPCIPAILLARKLAGAKAPATGAFPCLGLITLDEYLAALAEFDITWQTI